MESLFGVGVILKIFISFFMRNIVVGWNIVTTIGKFVVLVCFLKFLKAWIENKVANLLVDGTCSMLCEDAWNCLIN